MTNEETGNIVAALNLNLLHEIARKQRVPEPLLEVCTQAVAIRDLVTWLEFCQKLQTEEMSAYLTAFEMDAGQAKELSRK